MKTLHINQIEFNDKFINENEDILPKNVSYVYRIIKKGVRKEDRNEYPNSQFFFDLHGSVLLEYDKITKNAILNYVEIYYLLEITVGEFNHMQIKHFFRNMLKTLFKWEVEHTEWFWHNHKIYVEKHFSNIK